jgi:hypothetical protein
LYCTVTMARVFAASNPTTDSATTLPLGSRNDTSLGSPIGLRHRILSDDSPLWARGPAPFRESGGACNVVVRTERICGSRTARIAPDTSLLVALGRRESAKAKKRRGNTNAGAPFPQFLNAVRTARHACSCGPAER